MYYGFNGKRLRVDLSKGTLQTEDVPEEWYKTYLGGMGSIAFHLLNETTRGIDPLSRDNILIFAPGILTGSPFTGSGRNAVGGKSPLTGGFGEADAGGYWGAELKHAGFDEIIVTGCSETPVWLYVKNGEAELRDASAIWGKELGDSHDWLIKEAGDPRARSCLIGPAGENLARLSCVINDLNHVAGRSGMGALMGSKKLKAVVARGEDAPKVHDPEALRELAKRAASRVQTISKGLNEYGTGAAMDSGAATGNLPTRNFRDAGFEGADKISAQAIKEQYRKAMGTCYACAVMCKKEVEIGEPWNVDPRFGGPEYETLAALGSDCGIDNLEAICKGNELCQRYGLDTIGAGTTIAFAMELYEYGLIPEEHLSGLKLDWGNWETMLTLLKQMAYREGLGDLLADGSKRAGERIGGDTVKYSIQTKGQEFPMHEPRYKKALGLGYALSPTGGDHNHNMHDTGIMRGWNKEKMESLGKHVLPPVDSLGPEKVSLYRHWVPNAFLMNSLCICGFTPWKFTEYSELIQAVTGWEISAKELAMTGDRIINLCRVYNLREGFTAADDRLPDRMFTPQTSGALNKVTLTREELNEALQTYYELMGWTNDGVPRRSTLIDLDVGWAWDCL